ncbi:hypothetical protein IKQ21_09850 [bacterium]|nr:hypothetical protein [bacterium]
MRTEKVSFKSRINFVTYKDFNKFRRGKCVDFRDAKTQIIKAEEFFLSNVESDISGGLIDTKNRTAIGFSFDGGITDNAQVRKFLKKLFRLIPNADRGLIIGAKDWKVSSSSENFDMISGKIRKKIPNVSMFREHIFHESESNVHYDLYNDEWTISTKYKPLKQENFIDVTSGDEIKMAFRHAKVAEGDTLFIDGFRADSSHFI